MLLKHTPIKHTLSAANQERSCNWTLADLNTLEVEAATFDLKTLQVFDLNTLQVFDLNTLKFDSVALTFDLNTLQVAATLDLNDLIIYTSVSDATFKRIVRQ